ncbi:hypothetical protein [Salegentibacter mishustinae]|uniref:hypothetical protein n=1 Tax=Salegentibacter mishustinae TaxID=270918 RepID=UPI002492AA58|nr:hypothetical protein [Salegentibacter mishustinae]
MTFTTIDEIKDHFQLQSVTDEELKKEIKKLMKKHHPDPSGNGTFKSEKNKKDYLLLGEAFEFLSKKNNSLTLKNEIQSLTKIVNELALTQQNNQQEKKVNSGEKKLRQAINGSIKDFHSKNKFPKISSLVIAGVISAIWAFPNSLKDNPTLSFLYENHQYFTIVWLSVLIFSVLLWFIIKTIETKDEQIKKTLKVESVQNQIFILFTRWKVISNNLIDTEANFFSGPILLRFSKDELSSFLLNEYHILKKYHLTKLSGFRALKELENIKENERRLNPNLFNSAVYQMVNFRFLPRAGELDIETSQLISDLIIERLEMKEIIKSNEIKSLSTEYIYEFTVY